MDEAEKFWQHVLAIEAYQAGLATYVDLEAIEWGY